MVKVRAARDGSFYIVESNAGQVDRVDTNDIITLFAGNGSSTYSGDGTPASQASLSYGNVTDVAVGPDGSVYITDGFFTARRVNPSGIISRYAGTPGTAGFSGENGPATAATLGTQAGVRVAPDNTVYIADHLEQRVRRIQPPLPGFSFTTNSIQIASQNGTQIYTFDGNGRHLQTIDAFTGAIIYQFNYDSAGRLSAVAECTNATCSTANTTTIDHDANGNPTSIVPPFAQATMLGVDANGYMNSVTDPAGEQTTFAYSTQGLMASMTDARGGFHQFQYDTSGLLKLDQDPAGGSKTLASSTITGGFSVDITTSLGRQSTYQTTVSSTGTFGRQNTLPGGTQSSLRFTNNSTTTTIVPDGTTTTTSEAADPRFGMLSPMPSTTITTPSGLTSSQVTNRSFTPPIGPLQPSPRGQFQRQHDDAPLQRDYWNVDHNKSGWPAGHDGRGYDGPTNPDNGARHFVAIQLRIRLKRSAHDHLPGDPMSPAPARTWTIKYQIRRSAF